MTKKTFISQIMFNFILSAVFIWFAIDNVNRAGWGFFSIIFIFFATNDFVRGIRLLTIYKQIKNKSNLK